MRVFIPRHSRYVIAKTAAGFRSIDVWGEIRQWDPSPEQPSTSLYALLRLPRCNLAELFEKCGKP